MNFVTFNVKPFLKYENKWCETMNYFNPYLDPFENRLSSKMSYSDSEAYDNFPDYNWVYDKLVIAKSQGLMSGKLEELNYKTIDNLKFPIFIKPRLGNKTGASKNCYKIKNKDELKKKE